MSNFQVWICTRVATVYRWWIERVIVSTSIAFPKCVPSRRASPPFRVCASVFRLCKDDQICGIYSHDHNIWIPSLYFHIEDKILFAGKHVLECQYLNISKRLSCCKQECD